MTTWRNQAACGGIVNDTFFGDPTAAKRLCQLCPVRPECLDWALKTGEWHGVWGGLDEDERRDLALRRRGRPRVPDGMSPLLQQLFYDRTTEILGGHLHWNGPLADGRRPQLRHENRNWSVYRIAFRIGHGREPQGSVTSRCGYDRCVAPQHMEDRVIRSAVRPAA
ncbi:WhiB family transcriptional regulator [Streptomyces roseifaciens]